MLFPHRGVVRPALDHRAGHDEGYGQGQQHRPGQPWRNQPHSQVSFTVVPSAP